jgi:hypothetical protein
MNRRMFMIALGSGAATGGAAAKPPRLRQAPTISSYVTNVGDIFGQQLLPFREGARLRLWLDPNRTYDRNTVVVGTEENKAIGYLPTIHSQLIGPLLAAGLTAEAEVQQVRDIPRPALRITILMQVA